VIASTVPVGGHYFVDVFAGAAIAAACIAGLVWRPWLYRTGTPAGIKAQPAHAHTGTALTQQVAAS
jgi:membrane-associated phospholipid phosphatase